MEIQYIPNKNIDKAKWDHCINHAVNCLIYARSLYLDAMSENWDALVLNDYEAVMPVTWKSKWGIRYVYQPPFMQQLGIFYRHSLSDETQQKFIDQLKQHFKFAEFNLNYENQFLFNKQGDLASPRNNYVLDLKDTYNDIFDNYKSSFRKVLRGIKKFDMMYVPSVNYNRTIQLYQHLYGSRLPFFSNNSYRRFEQVCKFLFKENNVIIRHARSTENKLLASVIILKDEHRLYNMVSCITTEGKRLRANYFLYDSIMKEFAGSGLLFDFEGSDVEGIATFYKWFNPIEQTYPFLKYNHLSNFVKIFKK